MTAAHRLGTVDADGRTFSMTWLGLLYRLFDVWHDKPPLTLSARRIGHATGTANPPSCDTSQLHMVICLARKPSPPRRGLPPLRFDSVDSYPWRQSGRYGLRLP
jgi:hypothetical protein